MHDTALDIGRRFLETYVTRPGSVIVELGSMDVNGTLRPFCPAHSIYIGLDVAHGPSVDIVIDPGSALPIRDAFADVVVSTSQMEHDSFFWQSFLEICRILKPGGFLYMNAPSNGYYHRYPNDNWRFYPDAGHQLVKWAKHNGIDISLIESFTAGRSIDHWNDFVAVFARQPHEPPDQTALCDQVGGANVWRFGAQEVDRYREQPDDFEIIDALKSRVAELEAVNADLSTRLESLQAREHEAPASAPSSESENTASGPDGGDAPAEGDEHKPG